MSTLISNDYRVMNNHMHLTKELYGTSGYRWAEQINDLAKACKARTVLDYGAGKCTLAAALPDIDFVCYDPAIPDLAALPEPADLVVCTDVMEHIEPECLDAVLDHIQSLTLKLCFMCISVIPAKKHLPDGRNAHLIVQPYDWWLMKFIQRFKLKSFAHFGADIVVVGSINK